MLSAILAWLARGFFVIALFAYGASPTGSIVVLVVFMLAIGFGWMLTVLYALKPALLDDDPDAPELDAKGDGGSDANRQILSTL